MSEAKTGKRVGVRPKWQNRGRRFYYLDFAYKKPNPDPKGR
jgi:hypothetical protein